MKNRFKPHALSVAIVGVMFAAPVFAQEEESKELKEPAEQSESLEEVAVTGFRQTVERAVDAKRLADEVSDSIFAEDIGKSTDQNIADALNRISGVSVTEEGGEGARISIRGTSSYQNQIQMNGVALTSGLSSLGGGDTADTAEANQSVDLSAFSSDILSAIRIIKTATADQNEGSLGGTVLLETVAPLSRNDRVLSGTLESRFNDFSGEDDYRYNVSYLDQFFDNKLGVVFTASEDHQIYREDRMTHDWGDSLAGVSDASQASGLRAIDKASGKAIRYLNEDGSLPGDFDPDTEVAFSDPIEVMRRDSIHLALSRNERTRQTGNFGIQFQPSDYTDIRLDTSYTKQTVTTDYNSMRYNMGAQGPLAIDKTEWAVVNTENSTLEGMRGVGRSGWMNRSQGDTISETMVSSLKLDQQLTDTLTMNITAGYSRTDENTDDFVNMGTETWGTIGVGAIENNDPDLSEPTGYDCSTGVCTFYNGTTNAIFNPVTGNVVAATGRFNPTDLYANHLGNTNIRDNYQTDTNTQVLVDFDWDLDRFGLTTVEFGAKYANRVKDVHTQNTTIGLGSTFRDGDGTDYAYDGLSSVRLLDMSASEAFLYNNFGEKLGIDRSNPVFNGWPMIDHDKAFEALLGRKPGSIRVDIDNRGSRNIDTETFAAYIKSSFEGMGGRLRGNVGLRYAEDETNAKGYAGMQYYPNPHVIDLYDLAQRGLFNDKNPVCQEPDWTGGPQDGDHRYDPQNSGQDGVDQNCFSWRLNYAYDVTKADSLPYDTENGEWVHEDGKDFNRIVNIEYNDDGTIKGGVEGFNAAMAEFNGGEFDNPNGNGTFQTNTQTHWYFNNNGGMERWLDRSTNIYRSNSDASLNTQQNYIRAAPIEDKGLFDVLLPSLNLSYQINDELIGRFAASKTMTRPRFDSLNPSLQVNENNWNEYATGTSGNTQLKNLESINLDLSLEWYFGDSNSFSATAFHKDIKDRELRVETPYFIKDARGDYALEDANLLIDPVGVPGEGAAGGETCLPRRHIAGWQTQDMQIECREARIQQIQNGTGASIMGLELNYTQMYDFLPGIWSNLGVQANYTFQHSQMDEIPLLTTGRVIASKSLDDTPRHSGNLTVFWEDDRLSLRLANSYVGVQAVDHGQTGTSIWQDGYNRLDFSSSYFVNDNVTITFQATNLGDEGRRTFVTARDMLMADGSYWDEGDAVTGDVNTSRTVNEWNFGRVFRLGARMNF